MMTRGLTKLVKRSKVYQVSDIKENNWHTKNFESSFQIHKSDSIQHIKNMQVLDVDADIVRCQGGELGFGHPAVYIKIDTKVKGDIGTCKYCGLKFRKADNHSH